MYDKMLTTQISVQRAKQLFNINFKIIILVIDPTNQSIGSNVSGH